MTARHCDHRSRRRDRRKHMTRNLLWTTLYFNEQQLRVITHVELQAGPTDESSLSMYRPATAARPGRTMARNSSPPAWVVKNGTARRIAAIAAAFGASQLWQCGRGQSLHQADPDILLCSCRASCISLCILLSLSNSARGSGGVSGLETRARGALATRLGVTCSVLRCESYHSAVVVEHLGPLELPTNGQQVIGGVQLRAEEHTVRWAHGGALAHRSWQYSPAQRRGPRTGSY